MIVQCEVIECVHNKNKFCAYSLSITISMILGDAGPMCQMFQAEDGE